MNTLPDQNKNLCFSGNLSFVFSASVAEHQATNLLSTQGTFKNRKIVKNKEDFFTADILSNVTQVYKSKLKFLL